jgi:hypothetical protein
MKDENQSEQIPAFKDEVERSIPTAWRASLRQIVEAFVTGDYGLVCGVAGVEPVSAETASQVRSYVLDYGATLIPLPDSAWDSSVCVWDGDHWNALIDLWTQEEGRSDLVLHVRVAQASPGYYIEIHLVYVP